MLRAYSGTGTIIDLVYYGAGTTVSMKQASCLKEFEGGRSPSTDMKIRAQQRGGKEGVERGRRSAGGVR